MSPDPISLTSLLDAPAPAVLTTYRKDGMAVSSPVWFRNADDALEVVIADGDVKLQHLKKTPRCALLVFEVNAPFRGLRIEGTPVLDRTGVTDVRRAIARRYLGDIDGDRFTANRGPATIIRLPLSEARTWDLTAILP
ncbi:MAG: pyridoxamine 5'-phosphate oxidase family protein [Pseudonocardiales bacterium]